MARLGNGAALGIVFSLVCGSALAWPSSNEGVQQNTTTQVGAGDIAKSCDRNAEGEVWIKKDTRVLNVRDHLKTLIDEWANVDRDKTMFGNDPAVKEGVKTLLLTRQSDFNELARSAAAKGKEACRKCTTINYWQMLKVMGAMTQGKVLHSTNREISVSLDAVTEKMIEAGANNFENFVKYRTEQMKFVGNVDIQKKITTEIDDIVFWTHDAITKNTFPNDVKMAEIEGKWFCVNFASPFR